MKKLFIILSLLTLTKTNYSRSVYESRYIVRKLYYEKVYLHIDREMFSPSENIWFKVYLVGGINNQLLKGYKNVYVQLVNDSGRVVDDRLVLTSDGVAIGDFTLPYTIEEGQYTIRAYTKYMENFGEASYFHKKIWISTMKQQPVAQKEFCLEDIDIGFYPEGGNLVLNASNWVALKATDTTGRGIPITGQIVNDLGVTITGFSSEFLGMGKFSLMPKEGRRYYALLDDFPDYRYEFKDIQKNGLALHYSESPKEIKIILARNFSISDTASYILTFSHKGSEILSRAFVIESFSSEVHFSKASLPLGISKISLKDRNGSIVAERIIFIGGENENQIVVETDSKSYPNRSNVQLSLTSLLDESDSISGGLSVAVVNRNYLNVHGYTKDIRSFLLLDSELKGPIESSASYFIDERLKSPEKLDLLMMVQGWRSYYWPEIISKFQNNLEGAEDIGLTVEGTVKALFKNEVVKGGKVVLGPINGTFLDTITDKQGHFCYDRLYLRDSLLVMIVARTKKDSRNTEVFLNPMYEPDTLIIIADVNKVCMDPLVPYSYYRESFAKLEAEKKYAIESGSNWIEEVTIVEKVQLSISQSFKDEALRIYGFPDRTLKITDDDISYINVFDYLESNHVNGIRVEDDIIRDRAGAGVLILVDGIECPWVKDIPMGDIDYIDFMISGAKRALFGSSGGGGVVNIITRHGTLSTFERYVKGRVVKEVHGFQEPKAFYSPKYTLENINSEKPDYRPTLFWEPYVFLQYNYAELDFYTSDYHSDYIVIVEGISQSGKICNGIGEFTVGE